jgi:hypothetical protein
MRDHVEDRFLEHVLGLKQGLFEGVALRRPISDIREGDNITAVLLGIELNRVDVTEELLGQENALRDLPKPRRR